MSDAEEILKIHPTKIHMDTDFVVTCIIEAFNCAQACTACADACLAESELSSLVRCIRLNQDCSDVCVTTARMLTRQTEPDWTVLRSQIQTCLAVCHETANENERQAGQHPYCGVCAEVCRRIETACQNLLIRQLQEV